MAHIFCDTWSHGAGKDETGSVVLIFCYRYLDDVHEWTKIKLGWWDAEKISPTALPLFPKHMTIGYKIFLPYHQLREG